MCFYCYITLTLLYDIHILLLTTALLLRRGLRTSVTLRAMLAGAQAPSRATHARQVKG